MLPLLVFLLAPAQGPPAALLAQVPPQMALGAYVEPPRFLKAAADAGLPADQLAKLVKDQFGIDPAADVKDALLVVAPLPGGNAFLFTAAIYRGTAKAPTLESLLGSNPAKANAEAGGRDYFKSAIYQVALAPIAGAKFDGGVVAVAPVPTLELILAPPGKAARPLAERFAKAGADHDLIAALAMRPVRAKMPKAEGLGPEDAAVYDAPEAATFTLDFHEPVTLKVELTANSVEDAVKLMEVVQVYRKNAAILAANGLLDNIVRQAPEPLRKPLKALATEAIERGDLTRSGPTVTYAVKRPKDFGPLRKPSK